MDNPKCKICRRLGAKLFLKGARCNSVKCALVKRPYPPGPKKKKAGRKNVSEYGKELQEKQKLRNWYNLRERQFKKYAKEIMGKRGQAEDASTLLLKRISSRLDNIILRMGFADSRPKAKQIVSHNHFLVNNKKVNVPSFIVKKGDVIALSSQSKKKNLFSNISAIIKKQKPPSWAEIDAEKLEIKIVSEPTVDEAVPPVEISSIFEFYSK